MNHAATAKPAHVDPVFAEMRLYLDDRGPGGAKYMLEPIEELYGSIATNEDGVPNLGPLSKAIDDVALALGRRTGKNGASKECRDGLKNAIMETALATLASCSAWVDNDRDDPAGAQRSRDSLRAHIEKHWRRGTLVFEPAGSPGPKSIRLPTINLADLEGQAPPPREFAFEPFIPKGTVTLFTGEGGVGKSLFGQQLATAMASAIGKMAAQFLGRPVRGAAALYVTAEDDDAELHRRQMAICGAMRLPLNLPGLHLSSLCGEENNALCVFDRTGKLEVQTTFERLRATVAKVEAGFVVLDNVAHLFTGNENDRIQVTQFANLLNRLARETGATIVLVAHPNKGGNDYSGSTAWLNAVRSHVHMDCPRDAATGAPFDPNARALESRKANYSRKGERLEFIWRQGAFVRLDDLPEDQRKEAERTAVATNDDAAFLQCLDMATEQGRNVSDSPRAGNYAPKLFAKLPPAKGISPRRLAAAMDRLLIRAEIRANAPVGMTGSRHPKFGIARVVAAPECAEVALGCAAVPAESNLSD